MQINLSGYQFKNKTAGDNNGLYSRLIYHIRKAFSPPPEKKPKGPKKPRVRKPKTYTYSSDEESDGDDEGGEDKSEEGKEDEEGD